MKKTSRRLLSSLLIICLVGTLFPASAFAEGDADTQQAGVQISASMKDPITVKGGDETDPEVSDALEISNLDFTIERDYEQSCILTVENVSSTAKQFYLEVTNNYSDLSMEIIKNGSKDDPTFVAAGQSVEVELSVFAQNAENENYVIPITAYVLSASGEYEEAFTDTIDLTCKLPALDLSWELMQSNDSTLKQVYKVSNEGETLTDLTITASDEIKDYLTFSPFVTNYQLDANDDVQFEVWPDLAKMKNNNVSKLSGQLIASCAGKTSTYDCTFDTKGQEITITTMGKLAQQQDGNPFTKFEIAEDSVTLNYGDGTAVTEDTTIDDILDENGMFDLSSTMDLDLGVENNFPVEISMNSTQVSEEDAAQYENKTEIIESEENDSITIKTYIVLTEEEYQQMLDEAKAEMASSNSLIEPTVTSRAISDSEKKGRVVVETVFEINECYEYGGYGSNTISFIGDMYSLGTELGDSFNAANDPRLTREDKAAYIGCSLMKTVLIGGRAAVSITNPVVGLGFSILTKPLDYLIDKMQEAIIADAYREPSGAAIYAAIGGSQCTNRGSIKSSFYVPEYERSSTTTTSMHATSRMYGDGYVNKDNTNYNIILNGESVGTTNNAGLTEVAIAEIPTDRLQPGKTNTLTFDYDTDPGSHTVSTDTQITLLYPNNTEIGYIGTPEDLQDVRTRPDFCVYPENIYSDDPIVGLETTLKFNVYNRGSRGGWFTITCYDGSSQILKEENVYLAAFSAKTFETKWTPASENNTIKVELENTSVDLTERDSENNVATKEISARYRAVPSIEGLASATIMEDDTSLIVEVSDPDDVTAAEFTLDDTTPVTDVTSSDNNSGRRYLLTLASPLSPGGHSIKAVVKYQTESGEKQIEKILDFTVQEVEWIVPTASISSDTFAYGEKLGISVFDIDNLSKVEVAIGDGESAVVEPVSISQYENEYEVDLAGAGPGETTVTIKMAYRDKSGKEAVEEYTETITIASEQESYQTLSFNESISSAEFLVYDDRREVECNIEKVDDKTYRFLKTGDMIKNPDDYLIFISHDAGFIVKSLNEAETTIDTSAGNTLTVQNPDNIDFSSVKIYSYTDENGQTYYPNLNVSPNTSTITFTPGYYEVEFEGDPEGLRFSTSATVNLSAGDQTIDISDYILVYEFNVEDAADTWYSGQICYRQTDDKYWSSYRLSTSQSADTGRLTCTTTYPRLVEDINESDEAYLIIYSDTALYIMTIKGSSSEYPAIDPSQGATTLDPSTLNKVSLVCDPDAWQIQSVDVGWNGFSFDMYGETLYLPDGAYNFSTVLGSDSRILINKVDATVNGDSEIKVDQNLENFRDVTITWPTSFNATGSVYCETADGKNVRAGNFLSGSNFKTTDGMNEFTFELKQGDARFVIARDYEVSESAHEVTIGDNFTGALEGYYPDEQAQGAEISVSLSDLVDEYGNELTGLSAFNAPLQGNIVFTDVTDPSRSFTSPVTVQDLYGFKVVLPDEGGTYALTLELSTNGSEAEKPTYTVAFDSQGGSEVASQTVLEGDKVTEPIAPSRTGYTFTGWYTTAECTTKWDFAQAITGNMTLYAGWTASEEPEGPDEPGGTDTPDTPGGTDTPVNPPTGTDHPTYVPEISGSENGTIDVYPQKPEAGEEVIITPTPDEGYEVSDVIVTDENGEEIEVTKNDDGSYSYEQPDGEVVIEVVFEEISDTPGTAVEEIFADIPADAWYGEAVQYVYDLGLMTGTSDTTFEPATPTTRGMLVAILHRLEGGPDAESSDFSDVADNDWYGLAVSWAAENGIVGGYEDGTFQPNKYITREEMASILYRYCQYKGIDVAARADLSHYADAPSDWALEVMQWANAEGLINGRTATTINAQDDTIRAEMAAILQRYIENVL